MPNRNRAKYDAALEMIAAGRWLLDPVAGSIKDSAGQPIGSVTDGGYVQLWVRCGDGRRRQVYVHVVVWESVHGPIANPLMEVNHINGCKTDYRLSNLELITTGENHLHAYRTGLIRRLTGERHPLAKLSAGDIAEIRRLKMAGRSHAQIAAGLGISKSHVGNILRGHRWAA